MNIFPTSHKLHEAELGLDDRFFFQSIALNDSIILAAIFLKFGRTDRN